MFYTPYCWMVTNWAELVVFVMPTQGKYYHHIRSTGLINPRAYKRINSQQLPKTSTYKLTNSSSHQLASSLTPQLPNKSTLQLTNSSTPQLPNTSTHPLTSSSTHKLTNQHARQPVNSSTQKLKFLSFSLQYYSNFHSVLAKIWAKK